MKGALMFASCCSLLEVRQVEPVNQLHRLLNQTLQLAITAIAATPAASILCCEMLVHFLAEFRDHGF